MLHRFKKFFAYHIKPPPVKLPESHLDFEEAIRKQEEPHACAPYNELKIRFRDIGRMNAIIEALGRDFLTAMPKGAYQSRLGHIAFMYRRMHEDLTADDVRLLMDKANEHEYARPDLWDKWDRANLREMENLYRMYCHVDPEIVERRAFLSYEGRRAHQGILQQGDWEQAKILLAEQIELHRRIADARCRASGETSHYQMLMQEYMPGMTIEQVENLFNKYESFLKELMPKIRARQAEAPAPLPLEGDYDPLEQMWLNRSLLEVIGFDFERGGLYETGHNPVEGGTPEDTRLVIFNVDESNFLDSMKSALHEGGHGLYIQGLPRQTWRYQPVAMDLGAAVHESQALLIEMIIGRMPEFFEFLSPRLEGVFHGMNAPALSPDNLYALKTRVRSGTRRRKADEVTYFFHILLRFRLERALINGSLDVEDLPGAWNDMLEDMLGVRPKGYKDGCLQDVHWFVGKFGYFPSYGIGHMMAAQIFSTLKKAVPGLKQKVADGDFEKIKLWLNEKIYAHGRLYPADELLKNATGKKLKTDYLERHIRGRYLL